MALRVLVIDTFEFQADIALGSVFKEGEIALWAPLETPLGAVKTKIRVVKSQPFKSKTLVLNKRAGQAQPITDNTAIPNP